MALFDLTDMVPPPPKEPPRPVQLPSGWKLPPTFKGCAAADILWTFLNDNEFAEKRSVIYDDVTYPNILCSVQEMHKTSRAGILQTQRDYSQGLFKNHLVFYCIREDIGGVTPEQGKALHLSGEYDETFFTRYRIATSDYEMGLVRMELEEVDE